MEGTRGFIVPPWLAPALAPQGGTGWGPRAPGSRQGLEGFGAVPTLAAAQSIQPLPLGSMFMRTSPSTRSGKMSCTKQEG